MFCDKKFVKVHMFHMLLIEALLNTLKEKYSQCLLRAEYFAAYSAYYYATLFCSIYLCKEIK